MPILDPFAGAKAESEEQKKGLLDAIAQGGAEGKKAYDAAQASVGTMRQGALDRAQQRARLTGQDLGGADTAPVMETADRYGTYFTGQQAAGQTLLDQIGASGTSYLSKIGAIAPFMQQKALQQAADREAQIKAFQAREQADREYEAQQDKLAHDRDLEKIRLTASLRGDGGGGGGSAPKPTAKEKAVGSYLSPGAQRLLPSGQKLDNLVANIQLDTGNVIHSALPGTQDRFAPQPMSKDWIMQNVIMPGTNKKATSSRADDVLRAPEVGLAQEFITDLGIAKKDAFGKIDDSDFGSAFKGMTPREAFERWIDSQPGIRTMKAALKQYYGPYLDTLTR